MHDHEHGHHSHTHDASQRSLGFAAILTGTYMVAEVAGGLFSGSLALLADAGHMLTDFVSLSLAWYGFRLARRPADSQRSYGYGRFTILVAFANGLALFVVAAWISLEAWQRLREPQEVLGGIMLWIALAGLAVNLIAFGILTRGDRSNLNLRAALLHVAGDLLGSVAAIMAAIIIILTGWMPIDPLLSVLVALIILKSAWGIVRESAHILLEGTPTQIDTGAIASDLAETFATIEEVHHVHVWAITQERLMVTLHARLGKGAEPGSVTRDIKQRLATVFGVEHATVEIEFETCADG